MIKRNDLFQFKFRFLIAYHITNLRAVTHGDLLQRRKRNTNAHRVARFK